MASKRSTGFLEGPYRILGRYTFLNCMFVIAGAFFGERAVENGIHKLWEKKNVGKRYEDIAVLGQRKPE